MHFLVEHYFVLWDAFEPDSEGLLSLIFQKEKLPGGPGGSQKCKKLPGSDWASDSGPCVCEACTIWGLFLYNGF